MKKIINIICIAILIFGIFSFSITFADCEYNDAGSVSQNLDSCLEGSTLVNPGDGLIEGGVKNKILDWSAQLATLLSLIAIGAVVYGAGLMTVSLGDDEKIKKGKDVIKWSILGFLGLLLAGAIVRIVIEVMFSVSS